MNDYYVYVFLRSDRYSPYYVGKGRGRRLLNDWGRVTRRPKDKSRIVKVKENLSEEEAFTLEKTLIKFWGRIDTETGVLRNRTEGGDGTSGATCQKGSDNGMFGKTHSEETRRKISEACKGKRKGYKMSDETKRKLSVSKKKFYEANPEHKQHIVESNKRRVR